MPKFACRCGCVMNLSTGWSDCELSLVPENIIEELIVSLDKENGLSAEQFVEKIDSKSIEVLRCPQCNRLWLENEDGSYNSYIKETE
ncbi:hypothetical protein [Limnobaculum parvum]|uniref:Uncharacterized protein n=1 Tax=Limnobaculum parvum TaxID=2172103 RepID=A0A2Y9U293_9GAMM|nr:hypothetical protein [Limnobaculum parvum]AWH89933.1 hypothetical protein HYN51_16150 [Limnobaculum parvum]AWH89940.1 hypothetical protein HYN51_16185 [Limnobaculum parvum]